MRQIALDTETTGLSPEKGHRVIEIGCVEIMDRALTGRVFHHYLNPQRKCDPGAVAVHGLTDNFLKDKPTIDKVIQDFWNFVEDTEIIIHNAPFDVGFLNSEFNIIKFGKIFSDNVKVVDTLPLARKMFPGQKNNLDALCQRFKVDNSNREYHGALLDAELLAQVYLGMTAGQTQMCLENNASEKSTTRKKKLVRKGSIPVVKATPNDVALHKEYFSD